MDKADKGEPGLGFARPREREVGTALQDAIAQYQQIVKNVRKDSRPRG